MRPLCPLNAPLPPHLLSLQHRARGPGPPPHAALRGQLKAAALLALHLQRLDVLRCVRHRAAEHWGGGARRLRARGAGTVRTRDTGRDTGRTSTQRARARAHLGQRGRLDEHRLEVVAVLAVRGHGQVPGATRGQPRAASTRTPADACHMPAAPRCPACASRRPCPLVAHTCPAPPSLLGQAPHATESTAPKAPPPKQQPAHLTLCSSSNFSFSSSAHLSRRSSSSCSANARGQVWFKG